MIERLHPYIDRSRAIEYIRRLINRMGEDPTREGLKETPSRILRSWEELYSGYDTDPVQMIKTFENERYQELIIARDIEYFSMCEHHILPFYGRAHVAYIPNRNRENSKVIGLSKLARIVDVFARRLQIQERMTDQIADIIHTELKAQATAVIIEGIHMCMRMRGVGKQNSSMVTSAMRGDFMKQNTGARIELMLLLNRPAL